MLGTEWIQGLDKTHLLQPVRAKDFLDDTFEAATWHFLLGPGVQEDLIYYWGAAEVGLPLGRAVMWTAADYYYKPQKRGCDVEPKKWGVGGASLFRYQELLL